mgnify:CR=1 FL=1|jgi:mono/diheme cytochrome c family protein
MAKIMMAKRKINLLILVLPLLMAACSRVVVKDSPLISENVTRGSQEVIYPDAPPSVPDGQLVWQKLNCASCHGSDGKAISDKTKISLNDKVYMNRQKPTEQYKLLAFGGENLPADHPALYNKVSRREVWNLVFYVRSLARPPMTPAKVMEVDAVFGSNCAVCHGKKGYGDGPLAHNLEPIPANFQDFKRFYDRTDLTLWDHIANGIKWEGMPNFLGKEDKAKNLKFDDAYIWQLVDYVRHFQETTEKTLPSGNKAEKVKL